MTTIMRTALLAVLLAALPPQAFGVYIYPSDHDFGEVEVGSFADLDVFIRNPGPLFYDMVSGIEPAEAPFTITIGADEDRIRAFKSTFLRIRYSPRAAGAWRADLTVLAWSGEDTVSMSIPLRGEALPGPVCDLSDQLLEFPGTPVGYRRVLAVKAYNNLETAVPLTPSILGSDQFQLISPPSSVAPLDSAVVTVVFAPTRAGLHEGLLDTGSFPCGPVMLSGVAHTDPPTDGDGDFVGLYFDREFTEHWAFGIQPGVPFYGYLVLRYPRVEEYLTGWELKVAVDPTILHTDSKLMGGGINYRSAPEFTVGLAEPLPPTNDIYLAKFRFVTFSEPGLLPISLVPVFRPSLPGELACISAPDHALRSMTPVTGDPVVAYVTGRDATVGMDDDNTDNSPPPAGIGETRLLPNVPNPFNPETVIRYELARGSWLRISVYDLTGRKIVDLADDDRPAGMGEVTWHGRDQRGRRVASGAYYVRLETMEGIRSRKVMLIK